MKILPTILKVVGWIWLIIAVIIILFAYIIVFHKEDFSGLEELMIPSNFYLLAATIVNLVPGLILVWLSEKLKRE